MKDLIAVLSRLNPEASVGTFHPKITTWVEPVDLVFVHNDGTALLAPGEKRPEGLYDDELEKSEFHLA